MLKSFKTGYYLNLDLLGKCWEIMKTKENLQTEYVHRSLINGNVF